MITKIGFENVRVFKELYEFEIKPMTILTGTNNSGKSTIQKMLLLFSKNFNFKKDGYLEIESINFSHDFEITGDFNNNVNFNSQKNELIFSFTYENKLYGELKVLLNYEKSKFSQNGILRKLNIFSNNYKILSLHSINKIDIIKQDEHLSYLLEDPNFVSEEEQKYIWEFDFSQIDILNAKFIHSLIRKLRKIGDEEKLLHSIDKKLRDNQTLTKSEERIVNEYKQKGIIFNSKEAREIIEAVEGVENIGYYYHYDQWYIYDTNKKNIYKNNNLAVRISNIFKTGNDNNIIPTSIYSKVINGNIFSNSNLNDEASDIKNRLIKHNIFCKEDFIEAYKKFEIKYILWLYGEINRSNLHYDYYGNIDERSLRDFAAINMTRHHYFSNIIKGIDANDIIAQLISEEIDSENYITINLNGLSQTGQGLENNNKKEPKSKDPIINQVLFEIANIILSPIKDFLIDLGEFTSNLSLSYYSKTIKRHYLFDDKSISNSPFIEFGNRYINSSSAKKEEELSFINNWIRKMGFADELVVEVIKVENEIIGVSYFLEKNKKRIPLGNNGLGINNIILLLINIQLSNSRQSIIALEEPEANLHPAYQSLLAELLKNSNSRFIIETHSEYLIRKLQFLVAKKELKKEDVQIYYFNNPDNSDSDETLIKELSIRDDGMIDEDFGPGFFDESVKLTMNLLKLQN